MFRRLRLPVSIVVVLLGAVLAAAALATAASSRLERATHLFGRRYCELLFVHQASTGYVADVFNTYGLNSCPARLWAGIDLNAAAKSQHAIVAVRNGPRFWLMSEIDKLRSGPRVIRSFSGLRMIEEASLLLPSLSTAPYSVHHVNRATTWVYAAGETVFELRAPDRSMWVMQSYSEQHDVHLRLADLPRLGARLTLPRGWSYRVRKLKRTLRVVTTTRAAEVLQDNLADTYTRMS